MLGTLITLALIGMAVKGVFGFWSSFINFMRETLKFVSQLFVGAKALLKRTGKFIMQIIKSYNYDGLRWTVTTTTREIPPEDVEREVPADILARVRKRNQEYDVTDQLELKLKGCA